MNVQSKNISKNIWRELRKSRTFFSGSLSVSLSLRYCCQTSTKLEGGLLLQRLIPRNKIQRLSRIQTKIRAPMRKSRKSSCRSTPATVRADSVQVAGKAEKKEDKGLDNPGVFRGQCCQGHQGHGTRAITTAVLVGGNGRSLGSYGSCGEELQTL